MNKLEQQIEDNIFELLFREKHLVKKNKIPPHSFLISMTSGKISWHMNLMEKYQLMVFLKAWKIK